MEETISKNFIEQIIEKDIEEGHCEEGSYKISNQNQTDIFISDTQNPSY